jgi:methyl-accepting chemotaxis protein
MAFHMTFSKKLWLSWLLLGLPLIYLLYGIYSAKGQFIAAAEKELAGVPLVLGATDVIYMSLGGSEIKDNLSAMQSEVQNTLPYFDVRPDLDEVRKGLDQPLSKLNNFAASVTDKSGMILDPDADTYYLMDAFCTQIPNITITLHDMVSLMSVYAAHGAIDNGQRRQLFEKAGIINGYIGMLESDIKKIVQTSRHPFTYNTQAENLVRDLREINGFVDLVNDQQPINPDDLKSFEGGAYASMKEISHKFSEMFSNFVHDRINHFKSDGIREASFALALFLIVALGAQVYVRQFIIKPLKKMSLNLGEIAKKNVESFLSVSACLSEVTQDISDSVAHGRTYSMQLGKASNQVSANVQSVAAAVEEFSFSNCTIADRAQKSSVLVGNTLNTTNDIFDKILRLNSMSQNVDEIVSVINTIAEQTNLLSLNATIEAARAGEAGKGFSVVAGEVKGLANQTKEATIKVKQQLEEIQDAVHEASEDMGKVLELVKSVSAETEDITEHIEQQAAASSEIGKNVTEAAGKTGEVNSNIQEVARIIDQTNDITMRLIVSTKSVDAESENLAGAVKEFTNDLQRMIG